MPLILPPLGASISSHLQSPILPNSDQLPSPYPQVPASAKIPFRTPVPISPLTACRGQVPRLSSVCLESRVYPRGGLYLLTYCVLLGQPPDNTGEEHVTEGCCDEHNESVFVDSWRERRGLGVLIAGRTRTLTSEGLSKGGAGASPPRTLSFPTLLPSSGHPLKSSEEET